jgi:SAM-dependent methyltransferase
MNNPSPAETIYTGASYQEKNPDWHLADAGNKAIDILFAFAPIVAACPKGVRVADLGAGVGGVLNELLKLWPARFPGVPISATGFEIAPTAVEAGRRLHPGLDLREKLPTSEDGFFDVIMYIDVLEHLENPWEVLRNARQTASHLVVRQPLLENYSTFRTNNYEHQWSSYGHIGFFNYRSFLNMMRLTGWRPKEIRLLAPWELVGAPSRPGLLRRLAIKVHRVTTSYLISGFYLNGLFERAEPS